MIDQITKIEDLVIESAIEGAGFIRAKQNPRIGILNEKQLDLTFLNACQKNNAVDLFSIVCPNWAVHGPTRTVDEISPDNVNASIFFGKDIPDLLIKFGQLGLQTRLTLLVSDIFSAGWVTDAGLCKTNAQQNTRIFNRLVHDAIGSALKTTWVEEFPIIKVINQSDAIGLIQPNVDLPKLELSLTRDSLDPTSNIFDIIRENLLTSELHHVYSDRRNTISGLKKIHERIAFLSTLTFMDGLLMPDYIQKIHKLNHRPKNIIAVNPEMDLPFALITKHGWGNGFRTNNPLAQLPIITPTTHGTDWGEDHNL